MVLVVLALVGGGAGWFLGRGGDDGADGTRGKQWNTLVLQDGQTGEITLSDAEGAAVDSFPADMTGLLDVGLSNRLVLGVAGSPSTDGLGVINLDSGEITELKVPGDTISRLDTSAYLLASGRLGDSVALVDVAGGEVIDLFGFADTADPAINAALVRIDPQHSHLAFTELGQLETVLIDLDTQQSVSLAGSLVDIAQQVVLTITNRGQTSLVDLYGFDGERIGTVETDAAAGGLVLSDRSALIVTRAGGLVRVDFDDEKVDEIASIAEQLGAAGAASSATVATDGEAAGGGQDELVRSVVPALDRTRLVVLGDGGIAIVDLEGKVVAADRVASAAIPGDVTSADRCVLIGAPDAEQTLWDTSAGTRIETFDPGLATGRSTDGCTITFTEQPAGGSTAADVTRLVGPDVNRSIEGLLGAVAPDGSAAAGWDSAGAFVIDAESGDRLELPTSAVDGAFIER